MFLPQLLALALAPTLASAAIFPSGNVVKTLDAKGFRKVMKESRTSLVAFVAPWCGHCQRMAPEYSKAAKSLNPLVPFYAVDCDENKSLCAEQGVEGFPTVKLFPRGGKKSPVLYTGERTSSAFVDYATRRIPNKVEKLSELNNILTWVHDEVDQHRVLLLTKEKKIPTLWKVLDNKYEKLKFGIHKDGNGVTAAMLGVGEISTGSKILVYPAGSTSPARYEGTTKHDALSQFLDSVLDGTAVFNFIGHSAETEQTDPVVEQTGSNKEPAVPVDDKQASFSDFTDAIRDVPRYEAHMADFETQGSLAPDTETTKSECGQVISETVAETTISEPAVTEAAPTPEPVLETEKEADHVVPVTESVGTEILTNSENVVDAHHSSEQVASKSATESTVSASSAASIITPSSEAASQTTSHVQENINSGTVQPTSLTTSAEHENIVAPSRSDETVSETKSEVERPTDEL